MTSCCLVNIPPKELHEARLIRNAEQRPPSLREGISWGSDSARGRRAVWESGKLKEPIRNETLLLAIISGLIAWSLAMALKTVITGW